MNEMTQEHMNIEPPKPLRALIYLSKLYSKLTVHDNLYGSKLIKVPTPHFVVFYNGTEEQSERKELRVIVLNINPGYNGLSRNVWRTMFWPNSKLLTLTPQSYPPALPPQSL